MAYITKRPLRTINNRPYKWSAAFNPTTYIISSHITGEWDYTSMTFSNGSVTVLFPNTDSKHSEYIYVSDSFGNEMVLSLITGSSPTEAIYVWVSGGDPTSIPPNGKYTGSDDFNVTIKDYRIDVRTFKTIQSDEILLGSLVVSNDKYGFVTADVSNLLTSELKNKDTYDYLVNEFLQENASFRYYIDFVEIKSDSTLGVLVSDRGAQDLFSVNASLQVGQKNGNILFDYTILNDQSEKKFLTMFDVPKMWDTYPASIDFIAAAPNLKMKTKCYDVNGIQELCQEENTILENNGVIRYNLKQNMCANFFHSYQIRDDFEAKTIEQFVELECEQEGVYVNWLNSLGGRSHWLFHNRKEEFQRTSSHKSEGTFKKHYYELDEIDVEVVDTRMVSNSRIKIGDGAIDINRFQALLEIASSPNVLILKNHREYKTGNAPEWQQVRVINATRKYNEGQNDIEFVIDLGQNNYQSN